MMATTPLVVLDDDPTGTQSMVGVPVLLRLDEPTMRSVSGTDLRAVHLMTNSRALDPDAAVDLVSATARRAGRVWPDAEVILRGDSTLRGHLREEYEALRDVRFPGTDPVLLLAPALPAAGRVTLGGVHYLDEADGRIALHDSAYARDPAFGYDDARLLRWAEQRSGGLFRAERGEELHLRELRSGGAEAVAKLLERLAHRPGPAVCAPDAEDVVDLCHIVAGFERARERDVPVILRCAPTAAGLLSGAAASGSSGIPVAHGPVLVVCGSYVPRSTRQLAALVDAYPDAVTEAAVTALSGDGADAEVRRLTARLDHQLATDGLAVLATQRPGSRGPGGLTDQGRVADGLVATVRSLRRLPAVVVTKGGVTSASIVRDGLGAPVAHVVGPAVTGVGHWRVVTRDGEETSCLVVPGNVGGDDLLVELLDGLLSGKDDEGRTHG